MAKIIALALADIHLHKWKEPYQYKGNRLEDGAKCLKIISEKAQKNKVPVLMPGDLFHNDKALDNEVIEVFTYSFYNYFEDKNVPFITISGNHDQSQKNTLTNVSPSYIRSFSYCYNNLICLDNTHYRLGSNIEVFGIPYMTNNIGFNKQLKLHREKLAKNYFNILMIHTDLPGAKNGFGFEIGEVKEIPITLDHYFRHFDLVISGHIHKPQKLGKRVYMLGSPYQQNVGDMGLDMGYWEVYDNGKMLLRPLDLPKYRFHDFSQPFPNEKDIFIPIEKEEEITEEIQAGGFNNKTSKAKIAKNYLKKKGIKSKSKRKALINILIK